MHTWLRLICAGVAGTLLLMPLPVASADHASDEERSAPGPLLRGGAPAGPISLAQAVQIAIARHPSAEASRATVQSAGAQARALRSSQRLMITAANYFTRAHAPITFTAPSPAPPVGANGAVPFSYGYTMPDVPHYGQNIMAMLPVYSGGRGRAEVRSALSQQQAAAAEAVSTEQQIALQAKTAYHSVQYTRGVATMREEELKEAEARLRDMEERHRTDGVALYEVQRQRVEVARARQQWTNARRDLEVAQLDLKLLLGIGEEGRLELSDALAWQPVSGKLEQQLEIAARQSPEMEAAEARCEAAEQVDQAVKRSSKPNVYACLVQANAANIGARGGGGTVFAVCSYFPLFDSGVRRASREQARARVLQEKASCEAVKQRVRRDVTAAWLALQAAGENVSTSEAAATEAEASFRAVQLRYEARRSNQAELHDALSARRQARLDHLQALVEYNLARARLDRATGRI